MASRSGSLLLPWLFIAVLAASISFQAEAEINSNDLSSDTQALLALRSGLSYPGKKIGTWNTSTSTCLWTGVGCNPQQDRVWYLRLPASGLSGQIPPSSLGLLSALRILSLRSNKLSGNLPSDLTGCIQLQAIYLQANNLSGSLPHFNSSVHLHLSKIELSSNNFTGPIPASYEGLPRLNSLLLQNNSLTGSLAGFKFSNLQEFNVSNNRLNGSIPEVILHHFPSSSFLGNGFCGNPPFSACPKAIITAPPPFQIHPPSPTHRHPADIPLSPAHPATHFSTGAIIAIIVGDVALLLVIAACIVVCCTKKHSGFLAAAPASEKSEKKAAAAAAVGKVEKSVQKPEFSKDDFGSGEEPDRSKLVFFSATGGDADSSPLRFDIEDLLRASAEVLGKGTLGTAYKAVLEDGVTVVVKRLKDVSAGKKDFDTQMELIAKLRHKNLVTLRAYFYSKEEKLLVYDYVAIGSLCNLLHGSKGTAQSRPLRWDARLQIACGTAKAIAYIHEQGSSNKHIHGDIKSSNILLNAEFEPIVSDFGLAPLFASGYSSSSVGGTAPTRRLMAKGYRAPEMEETRKATQKSDVYSFGVLLLELLTGKAPTSLMTEGGGGGGRGDMELPRWVHSVVREEWTAEVFDAELLRQSSGAEEEEMVQTLQLALACVAIVPDQRPKMSEVITVISKLTNSHNSENKDVDQNSQQPQTESSSEP